MAQYAIVVARFYEDLALRLEKGARGVFAAEQAGVECFDVPGAFELPIAALYVAESGRFGGIACLGAVIRGETDHYEHVCAAAARGIQEVSLRTGVPCAFGVLTVDTHGQALERSGGAKRHSGADAARAVLALAAIRERLALS
jgi:6,7-dimethyl-8-ribityllumazine synthase